MRPNFKLLSRMVQSTATCRPTLPYKLSPVHTSRNMDRSSDVLPITRALGLVGTGLAAGFMSSIPLWIYPAMFTVPTLSARDRLRKYALRPDLNLRYMTSRAERLHPTQTSGAEPLTRGRPRCLPSSLSRQSRSASPPTSHPQRSVLTQASSRVTAASFSHPRPS